jgi:hypothetical protein
MKAVECGLIGQFGIVELCRVTVSATDVVGYGETLLHYRWERVSDEWISASSTGRMPGSQAIEAPLDWVGP